MKKIFFIFFLSFLFSCSTVDHENPAIITLLPVDDYKLPNSFSYGKTDTLIVKYNLPNSCYSFHSLYYQYQDTIRTVAVRAIKDTESACIEPATYSQVKFPIKIIQKRNYLFKFWKGKDNNGNDIYEEKVVSVN